MNFNIDPEDPNDVRPPERYRDLCYADLVEQIDEDWQEWKIEWVQG